MKEFRNEVAVVTGAGSGIGRALALALAREGARLAIADNNAKSLEETAKLVRAEQKTTGTDGLFVRELDVAQRDAVYQFADEVAQKLDDASLVINNAGVAQVASVPNLALKDLEWVMGINYWGVVYGTQAFLPAMLRRNHGHVVNISSVFGLIGVAAQAAYCSAKFAVLGYTESLRHDLRATNIGVSVVHPGGIQTNIARQARHNQGPDLVERQKTMTERFDEIAITAPPKAAEVILRGVRKNRPRILIGRDAVIIDWARRLFPVNYRRFLPFGGEDEAVFADDIEFGTEKKPNPPAS